MVWNHKEAWDKRLDEFKIVSFKDVDTEALEDECEDDYVRPIARYDTTIKKWEVVGKFKTYLEEFK